ncbi:hypothetical protein ON010_g1930 [Phytophthora cinnamomi]|nr:hypothetical protein ON010_g1930 [Phytophthora cinnamomi]
MSDLSSPTAKKNVPKHLRHAISSKNKVIPSRPKRKPRVYLAKRFEGEPLREWVQRNLESSLAGNIFNATTAVLSTFQALFHISLNWTGLRIGLDPWMQGTDGKDLLNLVFTLEYALHVYAAFDRLEYVFGFFPMVEFAVVLPSWFDLIAASIPSITSTSTLPQISRILRPLRFVRIFRLVQFATSSLQQQVTSAMLTIVSIVFATAGVVQATEACLTPCDDDPRVCKCRDLSFPNLLYFVVVSISTLGYGDISPVSTNGKFVVAFVILFTFIVVPIQVNRIQTTITSHTDYSSAYSEAKLHPHVIITGYVNADTLSIFFGEFFHPSNLNWNERVVILNAAPPTPEINKVLHVYDSKVQYIVGSPMLDEDLTRAVLSDASACYVLVNRQSSRPQYADQCCALITIALRRGNRRRLAVCVEGLDIAVSTVDDDPAATNSRTDLRSTVPAPLHPLDPTFESPTNASTAHYASESLGVQCSHSRFYPRIFETIEWIFQPFARFTGNIANQRNNPGRWGVTTVFNLAGRRSCTDISKKTAIRQSEKAAARAVVEVCVEAPQRKNS